MAEYLAYVRTSVAKSVLIIVVLVAGILYALPNVFEQLPSLQIAAAQSAVAVDKRLQQRVGSVLRTQNIPVIKTKIQRIVGRDILQLQFVDEATRKRAQEALKLVLRDNYMLAPNNATTTPQWLQAIGAKPIKLGLDLRGGVHFLLEVDMKTAVSQRVTTQMGLIRRMMRQQRIGYADLQSIKVQSINGRETLDAVALSIVASSDVELVRQRFQNEFSDWTVRVDGSRITLAMRSEYVAEIERFSIDQNLITLRNRVDELGVAEPLVQRQGRNRIVVELPGVQDTASAKRILGATANLEFRIEAKAGDREATPFKFRDGNNLARLENDIITTGNSVVHAQAGFDENSRPQVNIQLDSDGGGRISAATRAAVGRKMGVLFVEHKARTDPTTGERTSKVTKKIISLATIQTTLGSQFRITGLQSQSEAVELAILLRAGALAAPVYIVEERTIGPSLGAENIALGIQSLLVGLALVLVFMLVYYQLFGLLANIALLVNLVIVVAVMSAISATLTLPGIAGIILTIGMAVDANVLIFSRIREELLRGVTPRPAIHTGFNRAFVTIVDANVTTLLVAVILFAVGTGPVKGFAVTLSIGILASMFTAVMFTRAIIDFSIGNRNIKELYI